MDKATKEIRLSEIRAAQNSTDKMIVEGYALVFDKPTVLFESAGVKYSEVIKRGALDGADLSDVPFKYNHNDNFMIMARTRNKTLQFTVDDNGLFFRADLANTTAAKDLYELIKRGDIDKMSFGFTVDKDNYDRSTHTRSIEKFRRIVDVSAVPMPAYDQTSISARSYFDAQTELEERARQEELRQKLIIQTYL
jgi:HK97 family phage prohead protease